MLKPFFTKGLLEAGVDEAGRGCLAGPVFAAAVILPEGFEHPLINDSKLLNREQRQDMRKLIEQNALAFAVGSADHKTIDEINILNATFLAMHRAIEKLVPPPGLLLIDGNRFSPYPGIRHQCITGGDALYLSIAAASILAKTYRDDLMEVLHQKHPEYGWDSNKGYSTPQHRKAIREYGISPYHRRSFRVDEQLRFF